VLDVAIPPLRSRRMDIPLLVQHFISKLSPNGEKRSVSPRALAKLMEHTYPGNIRELSHAIEHAVVLARGGEIDLHHLPRDISGMFESRAEDEGALPFVSLSAAAREFERSYLLKALEAAGGNRSKAAQLLGISRKNLWEKLKAHRVSDEPEQAEEAKDDVPLAQIR
jgi:DNA-binding NtrC family response regulator